MLIALKLPPGWSSPFNAIPPMTQNAHTFEASNEWRRISIKWDDTNHTYECSYHDGESESVEQIPYPHLLAEWIIKIV
jgi:hypothetical protein